jgi:putative ABC transport system permease protein
MVVRMVAPVLYAPMSGDSWNDGIRIAGRPEPPAKEDTSAGWARVMPGFFETIGAKMLAAYLNNCIASPPTKSSS